jgi:cytochrome c oxidase subunit IV
MHSDAFPECIPETVAKGDSCVTARRTAAYRLGIMTFLVLAVLTALEYWVSISFNSGVLLLIIALVKAALIIQNFMHIARLWREESH